MKLYIAAADQAEARKVATALLCAGHEICADWLQMSFKRTGEYSVEERLAIARTDVNDVTLADGLVLLASDNQVAGGKFVEAGIAIGQGKPVFVVGRRENMLLWHHSVRQYDSVEKLILWLR